jgi:hypothetical protein
MLDQPSAQSYKSKITTDPAAQSSYGTCAARGRRPERLLRRWLAGGGRRGSRGPGDQRPTGCRGLRPRGRDPGSPHRPWRPLLPSTGLHRHLAGALRFRHLRRGVAPRSRSNQSRVGFRQGRIRRRVLRLRGHRRRGRQAVAGLAARPPHQRRGDSRHRHRPLCESNGARRPVRVA